MIQFAPTLLAAIVDGGAVAARAATAASDDHTAAAMGTIVAVLLCGLFGIVMYLLPCIIANQRRHANFGAITALNILLGWTMLGWIGALVWALTNQDKRA